MDRVEQLRQHKGKLVRHFKGDIYLVLGISEHTETGEVTVTYQAMYDDHKIYNRPIDMFLSKVDKVKYPEARQEYRMELLNLKKGEYTLWI